MEAATEVTDEVAVEAATEVADDVTGEAPPGGEPLRLAGRRGVLAQVSDRPHTPQQARRWSLTVAAAVALAYWFTQWPLARLLSAHPDYSFYLVRPAIWLAVAGLAYYGWLRLAEKPRFSRLLVGVAFVVGVFHVAVLVIAGVVWDFGDSPIAGRLVNYPKNFVYFTTLLAGMEMARAYLFQVWKGWNRRLAFAGVAAMFFAVSVAASQWTSFPSVDQGLKVVGGRWVPAIALSILCTWLVSYGGVGPSFAYRWALVAFEWFSPILPRLEWPAELAVGIGVPVVAEWMIRSIYEETAEGRARYPRKQAAEPRKPPRAAWGRWTGWGVTVAVLAVLVLFFVGAFGLHLSIVDGQSMEPAYSRGDVLFIKEGVDPASLQVGDVIQFHIGSLPVVHRIIAVEQGAGGPVFTTQGDARDAPDPPVAGADIDGKVVFGIPGIGYLNLWLRGR